MISEKLFKKTKELHCKGWSDASLEKVYLALVKGMRGADVARQLGGDRNVVYVLKRRFLELMQRDSAVKVPVDAFIASVRPAASPIQLFEADIRKLSARGYSIQQIQDFLKQNEINANATAIKSILNATTPEHGDNP